MPLAVYLTLSTASQRAILQRTRRSSPNLVNIDSPGHTGPDTHQTTSA
ncbi:MAG: hypothetical protein ACYCXP_11675 [Leptospirillum sp.]|nr:hypothetical protein [Nitrospiraceae bacterium]